MPLCRWSVRHEGAPQRGKGIAELAATVRSVTVSACTGRQVLLFWRGLGFEPDFELLREGQRYLVLHAGVEMQARPPPPWAPGCLPALLKCRVCD